MQLLLNTTATDPKLEYAWRNHRLYNKLLWYFDLYPSKVYVDVLLIDGKRFLYRLDVRSSETLDLHLGFYCTKKQSWHQAVIKKKLKGAL